MAEMKHSALTKIRGSFTEWGNRRRGIVSTGDNRRADFSDLGSNPCWVRLGEPTAESIRQALLADEARIVHQAPALPGHRILRLEVSSSLCGPNFKLLLNDGFNALIGGRGSGKSAALEYLRFGIGRSVFEHAGVPQDSDRVQKLLTDTLVSGFVRVTLVRGEIEEIWTRTMAKRNLIQVSRIDGSAEEITIEVAQQRFPARGYHQKELSSVVSSKRSAADQITGIAAAELLSERRTNDSDRASATLALTTAFQQLVEYWSTEVAQERAASAVEDLKRQVVGNQERLKAAGLSDEAQHVLAFAPEYARAAAYGQAAIDGVTQTKTALLGVSANIFGALAEPSVPSEADFDDIRGMATQIRTGATEVEALLTKVDTIINVIVVDLGERQKRFATREAAFQAQLTSAIAEQQQHKTLLNEASRLNAALETAEQVERQATAHLKAREQAPTHFDQARARLADLTISRRALLENAAEQTTGMSEGLLKASVVPVAVSDDQVKALCAMVEGSRIRSSDEKVKQHLSAIVTEPHRWDEVCNQLLALCRGKSRLPSIAGEAPSMDASIQQMLNDTFSFEQLTEFGRQSIWAKISPGTVTSVLTALPDAHIEFEFRDRDGAYIPFERASPGQQAAALLTLLLKQKAGTLLIDQPEDDLDNRVIMQMAQLLRTTKINRQLVFATHNPNFVVNGDADKVVVMNSGSAAVSAGQTGAPRMSVIADGAIETPSVRDAITDIMEGGKAAFELRGRKYDFVR